MSTLRIEHRHQGPSGSGQGGWTAARFEDAVGEPLTIAIRRPIPLETDLSVIAVDGGWEGRDGSDVVLTGVARTEPFAHTDPVAISAAAIARGHFPAADEVVHPVPDCFSCGPIETSMGVHAGPMQDGSGRFAVDWTVPAWGADDATRRALLWTAMDCTSAWYVGYAGSRRPAFTVSYAAEVIRPPRTGETLAVVAWNGDYPTEWDGRKRGAAAAAFDADGACVARARSFWVAAALDDPRITS